MRCKEQRAKTFRLDNPNKPNKGNLIGWLKNPNPDDSEEKGSAQVRDSSDSIEVIVVKKTETGISLVGEDKDLDLLIDTKKMATNTIRLPQALSADWTIDKTISELEMYNKRKLFDWQRQSWLKGSLGIILDENNQFLLNGYRLTYDLQLGLTYEKEGING